MAINCKAPIETELHRNKPIALEPCHRLGEDNPTHAQEAQAYELQLIAAGRGAPKCPQPRMGTETPAFLQAAEISELQSGSSSSEIATTGVQAATTPLPHISRIQSSFGQHDLSRVRTQVGGSAAESASVLGAEAYTIGDRVGFREPPSLFTAAHEATHVVQQRSQPVGQRLNHHEREADKIASLVVKGHSVEGLLGKNLGGADHATGAKAPASAVQLRKVDGAPKVKLTPLKPAAEQKIDGLLKQYKKTGDEAHLFSAISNMHKALKAMDATLFGTADLEGGCAKVYYRSHVDLGARSTRFIKKVLEKAYPGKKKITHAQYKSALRPQEANLKKTMDIRLTISRSDIDTVPVLYSTMVHEYVHIKRFRKTPLEHVPADLPIKVTGIGDAYKKGQIDEVRAYLTELKNIKTTNLVTNWKECGRVLIGLIRRLGFTRGTSLGSEAYSAVLSELARLANGHPKLVSKWKGAAAASGDISKWRVKHRADIDNLHQAGQVLLKTNIGGSVRTKVKSGQGWLKQNKQDRLALFQHAKSLKIDQIGRQTALSLIKDLVPTYLANRNNSTVKADAKTVLPALWLRAYQAYLPFFKRGLKHHSTRNTKTSQNVLNRYHRAIYESTGAMISLYNCASKVVGLADKTTKGSMQTAYSFIATNDPSALYAFMKDDKKIDLLK